MGRSKRLLIAAFDVVCVVAVGALILLYVIAPLWLILTD